MTGRTARVTAYSVTLALLLAACTATPAPSSAPAPSASPVAEPVATAAPAPLKIGVLLPYTEQAINGDIGSAQKKAFDLFLKQHGDAIGGRPVRAVWSDESVDASFNATKISLLMDQEKVDVLLGGGAAATAYALRDVADKAHIVYIDTHASGNALTRAVSDCKPSCKSRYVFRTSASSWQLSEPLGEWAAKKGATRFFAVYEDTPFGTESVAAFGEGLAKGGGSVTGRVAGTDPAKLIAAVKAQPSKDVFAVLLTDDAAAFLAAWAKEGLGRAGYHLYGPGPLTDQQVLSLSKDSAVGAVTSQVWTAALTDAESAVLIAGFQKEYTDEDSGGPLTPDAFAAVMWETLAALDQALAKTKGDAHGDELAAALEAVSPRGPRGALAFDAGHNVIEDVYVCEVRPSGGHMVNAVIDKIAKVTDPGR